MVDNSNNRAIAKIEMGTLPEVSPGPELTTIFSTPMTGGTRHGMSASLVASTTGQKVYVVDIGGEVRVYDADDAATAALETTHVWVKDGRTIGFRAASSNEP